MSTNKEIQLQQQLDEAYLKLACAEAKQIELDKANALIKNLAKVQTGRYSSKGWDYENDGN